MQVTWLAVCQWKVQAKMLQKSNSPCVWKSSVQRKCSTCSVTQWPSNLSTHFSWEAEFKRLKKKKIKVSLVDKFYQSLVLRAVEATRVPWYSLSSVDPVKGVTENLYQDKHQKNWPTIHENDVCTLTWRKSAKFITAGIFVCAIENEFHFLISLNYRIRLRRCSLCLEATPTGITGPRNSFAYDPYLLTD